MKAIWNNTVIAESENTIVVEGNHYFPLDSVDASLLSSSELTSFCSWKGTANYYSVTVDGQVNENAAWFYASPMDKAKNIQNYVAFWRGIDVVGAAAKGDLTDGMNPEDLVC